MSPDTVSPLNPPQKKKNTQTASFSRQQWDGMGGEARAAGDPPRLHCSQEPIRRRGGRSSSATALLMFSSLRFIKVACQPNPERCEPTLKDAPVKQCILYS